MTARHLHRRLSVWAALAIIGWALSGLTHPLMSLLGPRAVTFQPPSPIVSPLADDWIAGLQRAGVKAMAGVRQVMLDDEVMLQLWVTPGAPLLYASTPDGPFVDRDVDYAIALARHYSGQTAPVANAEHFTAYSAGYPEINRILPAWRVRFENGFEVDVSTVEDRLVGVTDVRRRLLSAVFRNVHTLAPLDGPPWLRVTLMLGLLISIWVLAFAGLRMLWQRGATKGLRRLHRWAGAALLLPLLTWTGTGALHLLHSSVAPAGVAPQWDAISPAALAPLADTATRRLWLHDSTAWALDDNGHYQNGSTVLSPIDLAQRIAGVDGEVSLVTGFGADYGFVNRRLPVWRVTAADGQRHFVDLSQGQVVAQVSALDRAELWAFNQIHKWQLFDGLGRAGRDALMSFFAASLLALAVVGLTLWARARRRVAKA